MDADTVGYPDLQRDKKQIKNKTKQKSITGEQTTICTWVSKACHHKPKHTLLYEELHTPTSLVTITATLF